MTALDYQHGGKHYKDLTIQPIEFIMANQLGFAEGCVVKYVTRWRYKGGMEDLRKARHFLEFILESHDYQEKFRVIRLSEPIYLDTITPHDYIAANQIPLPEAGVISHVGMWNYNARLQEIQAARRWLLELIAEVNE